jgi:surface protein
MLGKLLAPMHCMWMVLCCGSFLRSVRCEPAMPRRTSTSGLARTAPHVPSTQPEANDSGPAIPYYRRLQSTTGPSPPLPDVSCSSTVSYEQAIFSNCTHIGGDLLILHTAVATLAQLSGVATVAGSLTIALNSALSSLAGLETLTVVGSLTIALNPALSSLTGLESITSIGELSITTNDALVNLHGLSNVVAVSRNIYVIENNQLADIRGLCPANVSGTVELHMAGATYVNLNYCLCTSTFADRASLQRAVNAWCSYRVSAESVYGRLSNWNVSLVTDMSDLFRDCTSLGHVDLSRWDVRLVTTMRVRAAPIASNTVEFRSPRPSNRCLRRLLTR